VNPPSAPLLSIVMPVLDEAERIAAALDALAPWRVTGGVEVIVVDGGSRDATPALAAGRADRVLSAPAGRARQMNAGAQQARARALLFLHADTTLPAAAPQLIARALVDRAWGRSHALPLVAAAMNLRSRASAIATGDQAIFMRREAFDAVGGFPDQPLMEDIEISRRLRARCGAPACLREKVATSGRRWDRRGAARTILLM
jgi:rSAM/selenodomain-associated transferase 2